MSKHNESHLTANMNISKKEIVLGNFLGGLSWGIGTVIGAVVIGALIIALLKPFGIFKSLSETTKQINSVSGMQQQGQNYGGQ